MISKKEKNKQKNEIKKLVNKKITRNQIVWNCTVTTTTTKQNKIKENNNSPIGHTYTQNGVWFVILSESNKLKRKRNIGNNKWIENNEICRGFLLFAWFFVAAAFCSSFQIQHRFLMENFR